MVSSLTSSRASSVVSCTSFFSYLNSPCLRPCCCFLGFCFFSLILPSFDKSPYSSYAISPSPLENYSVSADNSNVNTKIREKIKFSASKSFLFTPYSFMSRKVDMAFHSPHHFCTTKVSFMLSKGSSSFDCECLHSRMHKSLGVRNAKDKNEDGDSKFIKVNRKKEGKNNEDNLEVFSSKLIPKPFPLSLESKQENKVVNHEEGRRHHENACTNFCVEDIVLYADESIIVVNKPPGMLCVPGVYIKDSIATRVADYFKIKDRARMVAHRLDQLTSGILVFARNVEALRHLHKQFAEKMVQKKYVALVDGIIENDEGEITFPIRKDMENPPKQIIDYSLGKEAYTFYKITDPHRRNKEKNCTLIELYPQTGRTHQLRIHLATLGHAIYGDDLYASDEVQQKTPRLCLHAECLTFKHPVTEENISFEAPHPFDIYI